MAVDKGEFAYLIGHTGAGKSTVIQLLARNILPSDGTVTVGGVNVVGLRGSKLRRYRADIGWIAQEPVFLPHRTVLENVALPLEFTRVKADEIVARSRQMLERVGIEHLAARYPHELSGGERQRTCLARALVVKPKLLLADEPTGHVDADTARKLFEEMENVCRDGSTVIMVTHDNSLVDSTKHRVYRLDHGTLHAYGLAAGEAVQP